MLHTEAGYTTDNLLLPSQTEGLAMREETIYDNPGGRSWEGRVPPRPGGASASINPSRWNSTIPGGAAGRAEFHLGRGSFIEHKPVEIELDNPGGRQFARPGMVCSRGRSCGSSRSHRVGPSHRLRPASCKRVRVSLSTSAWLQRIPVNGAGWGARWPINT